MVLSGKLRSNNRWFNSRAIQSSIKNKSLILNELWQWSRSNRETKGNKMPHAFAGWYWWLIIFYRLCFRLQRENR